MYQGYLIAQTETGERSRIPVGNSLVLGRAEDAGYVLDDTAASRLHLEVYNKGDEFFVRDLDSTNGTYVNGERIRERRLKKGDEIQVGQTILQFRTQELEAPEVKTA